MMKLIENVYLKSRLIQQMERDECGFKCFLSQQRRNLFPSLCSKMQRLKCFLLSKLESKFCCA